MKDKTINNILYFLNNCDLKGSEVDLFNECKNDLKNILIKNKELKQEMLIDEIKKGVEKPTP
ncbi:MAG: hypothetical protein JXQ96_23370 [Cyclobacteriaceae bacterium]